MFERAPTQAEWSRFLKNTKRVHYLDASPVIPKIISLHTVTIHELAHGRTNSVIFPNLRELHVEENILYPFFMSDTVTSLHLGLLSTTTTTETDVFSRLSGRHRPTLVQHICERMPRLTDLRIRLFGTVLAQATEADIACLIRGLPRLKIVDLPLYDMSLPIWHALSELEWLEQIGEGFPAHPLLFGEPNHLRSFGPPQSPLKPNAFPSLETLLFPADSVEKALPFLVQPHFPLSRLSALHLRLPFAAEVQPEDVKHLISVLAGACPSLYLLDLCIHPAEPFTYSDLSLVSPLRFEHIQDALAFRSLTHFIISHTHPIEVTESDLTSFASQWYHLESLRLNPRPLALPAPTLTLHALEIFAEYCPNIWSLGLYMDATSPPEPPHPAAHRFVFQNIYVGRSSIPSYPASCSKVAEYLARCIASWDSVRLTEHLFHDEVTHESLHEGQPDPAPISEYEKSWEVVEEMITLLWKEWMDRVQERRDFRHDMTELETKMVQVLKEKDALEKRLAISAS